MKTLGFSIFKGGFIELKSTKICRNMLNEITCEFLLRTVEYKQIGTYTTVIIGIVISISKSTN